MYINDVENKLNYTESLIMVIQINMNKKPMIYNELYDKIQNEFHRQMCIFNSKINNTSHHNYQIETRLNNFEELISKKVENLINNIIIKYMRIYQNN